VEKAGYDFNNPIALGKIVEVETYGLNKMQNKIQEQQGLVEVPKVGLGYNRCSRSRYQGNIRPNKMWFNISLLNKWMRVRIKMLNLL